VLAYRHSDGHPDPFALTNVEIGNEEYNEQFADHVLAMEAKALALLHTNSTESQVASAALRNLTYIFPAKRLGYPNASMRSKLAPLNLGPDRLVVDQHVNWAHGNDVHGQEALSQLANKTNSGIYYAEQVFQQLPGWGATNLETNCGDHTYYRALEEAVDMHTWLSTVEGSEKLHSRTASFCMERSGYQEAGLNDQGDISVILAKIC
jgi:hypothetical protein